MNSTKKTARVSAGLSIDHKNPRTEFLYLTLISLRTRKKNSSRARHNSPRRSQMLTRAATTRVGLARRTAMRAARSAMARSSSPSTTGGAPTSLSSEPGGSTAVEAAPASDRTSVIGTSARTCGCRAQRCAACGVECSITRSMKP